MFKNIISKFINFFFKKKQKKTKLSREYIELSTYTDYIV